MKTITIPAKTYKKFLRYRAIINGATKKMNQLKEEMELPEPSFAKRGEYTIEDENKNPIGKMNIYKREAFTVQASWIAKLS